MARTHLSTASERLASAAGDADGAAVDRLTALSDQLETLAEREHDPDHGRLARIESSLDEIQADASDEVAAAIADALDAIRAFRETIEGV